MQRKTFQKLPAILIFEFLVLLLFFTPPDYDFFGVRAVNKACCFKGIYR